MDEQKEYEELYKKIRETYIREYEAALSTQTELTVTIKTNSMLLTPSQAAFGILCLNLLPHPSQTAAK